MDSLMGWNLKDWRSYGGWVRDMEIVPCLDENNLVVGATREEYVTGFPWKNESFGFEERLRMFLEQLTYITSQHIYIFPGKTLIAAQLIQKIIRSASTAR